MNYIVQQILQRRKITDYLTKKGIFPSGNERDGKLKYHCPLHEGDNTPSFYVYLESKEFENFYCFGCKAKYHIIHLYSQLEKVSLSEAVKALADGIDLDVNSEIIHVLDDLKNDKSEWATASPIHFSLEINKAMYDFIKQVDYDPDYMKAIEEMSKIVDRAMEKGDMEDLKTIANALPDELIKRLRKYTIQKEDKEQEVLRSVMNAKID